MKYLYPFTNCQDIFLFHDVPRYHWFYASFSIAKVESLSDRYDDILQRH